MGVTGGAKDRVARHNGGDIGIDENRVYTSGSEAIVAVQHGRCLDSVSRAVGSKDACCTPTTLVGRRTQLVPDKQVNATVSTEDPD